VFEMPRINPPGNDRTITKFDQVFFQPNKELFNPARFQISDKFSCAVRFTFDMSQEVMNIPNPDMKQQLL
jgi:hypothetical protein